jgi:hypothetical protein
MAVVNISNATKTAFVTALNSALGNSATITFYTGTIPAGPDTAVTSQTNVCSVTFATSGGFGTVSGSTLTANGLPVQAAATAAGTNVVTWARLANSSGTAIVDVDVGTSGTTVIVANASVTQGNFLQITSCAFTAN